MATHFHLRPWIRSSFESTVCFGLPDPTTLLILEVVLKYKRWIFLRNRRGGQVVDYFETNSDDYACFHSPGLSSSDDLRDQIRVWVPGFSESLCTRVSQRIFQYTQQVAVANNNGGGGANKVTAFVEIHEPDLQPTDDDDQVQDCMGVWVDRDEHEDDGIILYFGNNIIDDDDDDDESSKPPRGLSCEEINGLKQERFTAVNEESLMCSICLEEFSAGVKITLLPCSHIFHHNCIASWLQKHGSCPFCRFDITQQCSSPSLKVLASNEII